MKKTFAVIGPGRMGQALIKSLTQHGYSLRGIMASTSQRSEKMRRKLQTYIDGPCYTQWEHIQQHADIVFITTPDEVIPAVANDLVRHANITKRHQQSRWVFHTSGALDAVALEPMRNVGYCIGTMHPLQTVTQDAPPQLHGIVWGIEGDTKALLLAEEIITTLKGEAVRISREQKPLYHAAAVFASNFIVALAHQAVEIMQEAGMTEKQAQRALIPLIQGAVNNMQHLGTAKALTGPFQRGDVQTIQTHIKALTHKDHCRQWFQIYKSLGTAAVHMAQHQGDVTAHVSREIHALLSDGKNIDVACDNEVGLC